MPEKKQPLLKKIIKNDNRTIILPMDHGVSDGPIPGLVNMEATIKKAKQGGVDAIVIHKGIFRCYKKIIGKLPVLIHISASTGMGEPLRKVTVASVEEIKNLGAQGVSIHVNLANQYEPEMIKDLGRISEQCQKHGLPLLAMVYPRNQVKGKLITFQDPERVAHAARLAAELGADLVKVPYTGSAQSFKKVIQGCPIPVVIAGGDKSSEAKMVNSIKACVKAGAAGVSVGRNVFQAQNMITMIKKIKKAVHV
ncbi:MAG: fructose-bisphosphate aldolase [Candidatus Moranbacteria bacterium]|nr:fructose-bisphosphate aldolase [Candidatus Moranbacteria bacterium]